MNVPWVSVSIACQQTSQTGNTQGALAQGPTPKRRHAPQDQQSHADSHTHGHVVMTLPPTKDPGANLRDFREAKMFLLIM